MEKFKILTRASLSMRNGGTFCKGEVLVLTFIKVTGDVKSICKGKFYERTNERILFHAIENPITGLIGCRQWMEARERNERVTKVKRFAQHHLSVFKLFFMHF